MTVLGLDPGTATIGYALVTGTKQVPRAIGYGVITTMANQEKSERLVEIGRDLEEVLDQFKPDLAVIEDLFYFKNQKTVISVAEARGVLVYLIAKKGLIYTQVTPLQVKQSLTGYGRATKDQMQRVIQKVYRLATIPKPDDAADALALAWCGLK